MQTARTQPTTITVGTETPSLTKNGAPLVALACVAALSGCQSWSRSEPNQTVGLNVEEGIEWLKTKPIQAISIRHIVHGTETSCFAIVGGKTTTKLIANLLNSYKAHTTAWHTMPDGGPGMSWTVCIEFDAKASRRGIQTVVPSFAALIPEGKELTVVTPNCLQSLKDLEYKSGSSKDQVIVD